MTYKTYLFDMDGTLLDTLDDLTSAVNHTMAQYGYPRRTREEVRRGSWQRRGEADRRLAAGGGGYAGFRRHHAGL